MTDLFFEAIYSSRITRLNTDYFDYSFANSCKFVQFVVKNSIKIQNGQLKLVIKINFSLKKTTYF